MSVSERWIPQQSERILTSLINPFFPSVGSKDITKLTIRDLLFPPRKIEAKGQHETVSRLKQHITAIMRYAVQKNMISQNLANELGGTLITPKRTHYPALELNKYQIF